MATKTKKVSNRKKRGVQTSKRIVIVDEFPWHAIDKWAEINITPVYPFSMAEWLRSMKEEERYRIVNYVRDRKIAEMLKKSGAPIDRRYKRQYVAWRPGDEFLLVEEDDGDLKGWYVTVEPPK